MRSVLGCLALPLVCSVLAAGGEIDFPEDFKNLSKWENVQGVETVDEKLVLVADSQTVVGSAEIKSNDIGETDSPERLRFTALGADLSAGGHSVRYVTLRVRRGTEVVYGSVRVTREARGGDLKTTYFLAAVGGGSTAGPVASSPDTGNIVLTLDGTQATLSFAGEPEITLGGLTAAPVNMCRIELMANQSLGGNPSIEGVEAKSDF
ncbi:MAG: hypothetical protein ACYS9X_31275 [Planctomycetota bacterium]|jgi:hypothetical protein